jgi:acetyltransferase EpsM
MWQESSKWRKRWYKRAMRAPVPVLIPLLNPNEVEIHLAELPLQEGQAVVAGDRLATLETTKSTSELLAEEAGYVTGLRLAQGDTARVGEVLCYLAEAPGVQIELPAEVSLPPGGEALPVPAGLRITRPALALAHSLGLDLARLPVGPLLTEATVRYLAAEQTIAATSTAPAETPSDPTALIVYGAGGHGKSLIELVRLLGGYRLAGVIDDGVPAGSEVLGVPVLGGAEVLPDVYARGVRLAANAVGGIGNLAVRIRVFERLAQAGFDCPAVVHPTAFVEASASLSPGVQVFPHAYVGSSARAGFGVIINTGAIISHDVVLGDYTNVSPGAMLAGAVTVGERTLIGMGVTINLEVAIGAGVRIGNGATVKQDVPAGAVVHAGAVWPG